ncbi:MAG: histidine kinase [Vicinamibacterales bacterium]
MTKRRIQWLTASAFWTLITVLYDVQIWLLASQPGEQIRLRAAIAWQSVFYLAWIPFTVLLWRLTPRWDPGRIGWTRFLGLHLAGALVVSILHAILVALVAPLLAGPQPGAPEALWDMLVGQLRGRIYLQVIVYAGIVALGQATALHARWRDRDAQAAALEAQLTAARLDALRAQLQPHFLFNSLHAVASLVRDGRNADAVRLISGLSDLLRRVLDTGDADVALSEELELVRRYVDIQQVRFGDRLAVTIDVEPGLDERLVPALVVQPLVENALRHGIAPRPGPGRIGLRVFRGAGGLVIEVEDDGVGLPEGWRVGDGAGTGLRNLIARLEARHGGSARLAAGPGASGGTIVRVVLPADAGRRSSDPAAAKPGGLEVESS